MTDVQKNVENRSEILGRLRKEIVGPDPSGAETDFTQDIVYKDWGEYRTPKRQLNGEECLWQDPPSKRYGAGILFPQQLTELGQIDEESDIPAEFDDSFVQDDQLVSLEEESSSSAIESIFEEDHVALTNCFKPSALGLSFLADVSLLEGAMRVEFACIHSTDRTSTTRVLPSTYKKKIAHIQSADGSKPLERDLWLRTPFSDPEGEPLSVHFDLNSVGEDRVVLSKWIPGQENFLEVLAVVRDEPGAKTGSTRKLITVSIVNRNVEQRSKLNELCVFQAGIRVHGEGGNWILPYTSDHELDNDQYEDKRNRLLYRNYHSFALGHGVSANWYGESPKGVSEVWSELVPAFETPTTSADLKDSNGLPLRVSMRKLAGLDETDNGTDEVKNLIEAYEKWILDKVIELSSLTTDREIGERNINLCKESLERIRQGFEFLQEDNELSRQAMRAFRLTNHAMLISQLRASREVRSASWSDQGVTFKPSIEILDESQFSENKGYWRAFQICFLLMNLPDITQEYSEHRETADLIWFPTGGGKTEAYLGLSAFTIFFNRITGKSTATDVLMRYTLRLLTAQQFQRAGLLFCAMDHLRRRKENSDLGDNQITLGMWVGRSATPNTREQAINMLKRLQKDSYEDNPFVLLKCPWCHAEFGPVREEGKKGKSPEAVLGYRVQNISGSGRTVVYRCPDPECEYGHSSTPKPLIPISIIDEDIYDNPPDMLIGTVDKFALLAWEPKARSVFGIGESGEITNSPPSLIIQDELHLISGPLGSVMGAFETLIEELATNRDSPKFPVRPKIVASTATISRASEQILALYGRERSALFPPAGLEAADSFFSQELRDEEGTLMPGRMYVGVFGSGYSSQQTAQARIFAALLQWGRLAGDEVDEIDPWFTLLSFFNSIRELGGAATLLVSDTRDYLRVILDRHGIPYSKIRQLLSVRELTSRIRSDQIPLAIQDLEKSCRIDEAGRVSEAVEACLASNIIEVGVDIDRLSLMSIVGQPKTTSQYIQVSSRVGRSMSKPGLVVVTYNQGKPRDRSHYEQFRAYHQKLYAQVEPTSVTPFCPPTVDRVLHSLVVGYVRQKLPIKYAESSRPSPLDDFPESADHIRELILQRVRLVDEEEEGYVARLLEQRFREWSHWDPQSYGSFGAAPENPPLMHPAGSIAPENWQGHSWPTLSSMRDVDANCEAEVTQYYNSAEFEEEDETS